MGVSYYVYIGPYIEAPNPKKKANREFHGCRNDKCHMHNQPASDKFCSTCGKEIGLVSVPDLRRMEFDVYEECDDRLSLVYPENLPDDKKDFAIFQPNQGKFGMRLSAYDPEVCELNESVMMNELSRFHTFFAKDIARIKEVFGKAEVKWGVIAYAS